VSDIFEKLGLFYLGKDVDARSFEPIDVLTLMKSKHFTTHAAIIGMTGSGKTGLGIGLIEEAAIDNIPAIIIDPKGDMGNLCLTFEGLKPKAFEPWVRDEAETKGEDVAAYAKKTAELWKKGLKGFQQDVSRIKKLKSHDVTIYTPGSSAGISVSVLSSLDAPGEEILEDADMFASYIHATVASLLALISIEADPLESKEYILLGNILKSLWMQKRTVTLEGLIALIINPPFDKIGVLPLKSFYPQNDRFKLATLFNNVIASPSFENWISGVPLDIQKFLYDDEGKARISIFSISHLSDEERMFFVTLLLNRYIAWMRRQSGTGSLKTLLYMDEIYGFFPPQKNPPSKEPMMLLLKQARAFGVGVVLSTQNPVDLDYKGLSNIGTWFIGRLQTRQDVDRIIDGLGDKLDGGFDKGQIRDILANLKKRTFFLKSAHLDEIRLFTTRWVLSYLKGPLKRDEIALLMREKKEGEVPAAEEKPQKKRAGKRKKKAVSVLPILSSKIPQLYQPGLSGPPDYEPWVGAKARVGFFSQTHGVDETEEHCLEIMLDADAGEIPWEEAASCEEDFENYPKKPPAEASFAPLPALITEAKDCKALEKALANHLYHTRRITLYRCKKLKLKSGPGDSLTDFKVKVQDAIRDLKEKEIERLQEQYDKKEKMIRRRYARAKERLEKEEADVASKTTDSIINAGVAVLGALFGRRSVSRVGTALKSGKRVMKERGDVSRARARLQAIEEEMVALEDELQEKIDLLALKYDPENFPIDEINIKPRRSDVSVKTCALVWKDAETGR